MHRNLKAFKEKYTGRDIRKYLKERRTGDFGYLFGQKNLIQGLLDYPQKNALLWQKLSGKEKLAALQKTLKQHIFSLILIQKISRQKTALKLLNNYLNSAGPVAQNLSRVDKLELIYSILYDYYWKNKEHIQDKNSILNILSSVDLEKLKSFIEHLRQLSNPSQSYRSAYTNFLLAFNILTPEQIDDYLAFHKTRTFSFYFDDHLTSNIFYSLYKNVAVEQRQEFMAETLLMNKWELFNENRRTFPPRENNLFENVKTLQEVLPDFRAEYFRENQTAISAETLSVPYQLKLLPNTTFSIEDLFNFLNSDNVSFFRAFSYMDFQPTAHHFIRRYSGLPLSVLHGSRSGRQLGRSGVLKIGKYTSTKFDRSEKMQARNNKYIFFGSLWNHFSRAPACREINPLFSIYGDTVLEFPLPVLSRTDWPLRGNVFHTFRTRFNDPDGVMQTFDIVESQTNLDLASAVRVYCASAKMQKFWSKLKRKNNWPLDILSFSDAPKIAEQIYVDAQKQVEQFILKNAEIIETFRQEHEKLNDFLLRKCADILENTDFENRKLLEMFIKEYACVIFSDFINNP
jgi:hypothetical protein